MYILALDFSKKMINMYIKLEIHVVCREFLAFRYIFIHFFNKSDDYLYLYNRNLENSCLKPVFRYTMTILFVFVGREY